jgi:hypothetical protein
MKPETLQLCIAEAKRFIEKAEQVPIIEGVYDKVDWSVIHGEKKIGDRKEPYIETGKASGAARRASLDLTRCLADLRQRR